MRRPAWLCSTPGERDANRLAVSLFFGALLGTNLAALEGLALDDYVAIIMSLAALVMGFQQIGHARSRGYALGQLAVVGAIGALVWWKRDLLLGGVDPASVNRLFATLCVWLGAVVVIEATPVMEEPTR